MRRSDNMESIMIKVNDKTIEKMKKFYASQMLTSTTEDVIFKAQIIGCTIGLKKQASNGQKHR